MAHTTPITAVIPNRDGEHLLRKTLPPLLQELPSDTNEILIVDDASKDNSVSMLRREFPMVRVEALPRNIGFGAACNHGFQLARHPFVLLLNSDMGVTPGAVAMLAEDLQDRQVFAAGPEYWSDDPSFTPPAHGPRDRWPQLGAPAGGGLFRREVFLELGGFDPLYRPFYWEDIDLGWNAWRRGWRVLYDCRCHFFHLESATIRRLYSHNYVERIRMRNRCLFGWKNIQNPSLLAHFLAGSLSRSLSDAVYHRDSSRLLGMLASLPRISAALARRFTTHGSCSDRDILAGSETRPDTLLRL